MVERFMPRASNLDTPCGIAMTEALKPMIDRAWKNGRLSRILVKRSGLAPGKGGASDR